MSSFSGSSNHTTKINAGMTLALALTTSISYMLYRRNKSLQLRLKLNFKLNSEKVESHPDMTPRSNGDSEKDDGGENDTKTNSHTNTDTNADADADADADKEVFQMRPIGTISSPFPLRAGTPRQGLLAPHARSILVLSDDVPMEMVEDLEQYSHAWIIFQFHLNPVGKAKAKAKTKTKTKLKAKMKNKNNNQKKMKNKNNNQKNQQQQLQRSKRTFSFTASKIKPPRANGQKVGVLATRSPHRPNPIGLSLAMVECVTTTTTTTTNAAKHQRGKSRPKKLTVIHLLGLDLVDGTPVYDIKPYIPFDGVVSDPDQKKHVLRTPSWVVEDGELSSVQWTDGARGSLRQCRADGLLEPFYPATHASSNARKQKSGGRTKELNDGDGIGMEGEQFDQNDNDDDDDEHGCDAMRAISEIIGQDPRARHEGRGRATHDGSTYEISFCNLRVFFSVEVEPVQSSTFKSASSDDDTSDPDPCSTNHHATITQVIPDKGDDAARPGSYQYNLAMRRKAEKQMNIQNSSSSSSSGRKLHWMHPVREGSSEEELYMLRDGSIFSFDDTAWIK